MNKMAENFVILGRRPEYLFVSETVGDTRVYARV